ncbi:hypothetical protein GUJ93_ZPchr0012g19380 [Zizania palustris]|uniref:Uncharacterized protein n=1 Tax=Zizania palustris TaxID=103762 RepID=A0A8J5WRL2_ZIZPA|nr:hypothetical protein GUJ93_ZPchr0012g19380 [Zizania palustris]
MMRALTPRRMEAMWAAVTKIGKGRMTTRTLGSEASNSPQPTLVLDRTTISSQSGTRSSSGLTTSRFPATRMVGFLGVAPPTGADAPTLNHVEHKWGREGGPHGVKLLSHEDGWLPRGGPVDGCGWTRTQRTERNCDRDGGGGHHALWGRDEDALEVPPSTPAQCCRNRRPARQSPLGLPHAESGRLACSHKLFLAQRLCFQDCATDLSPRDQATKDPDLSHMIQTVQGVNCYADPILCT